MSALLEKLKKQRQSVIDVGGFKFTITRPTDYDAVMLRNANAAEVAARFVVGWNLKEIDVINGGAATPAEFEKELFEEWLKDNVSLMLEISNAILDSYKARIEALGENEKK